VPIPAGVLQDAERKMTAFCRRHSTPRVADRLRYEFSQVRNDPFLHERRASFTGDPVWSNLIVARLRYHVTRGEWFLYWADCYDKWHLSSGVESRTLITTPQTTLS
jgi:hypothetical protein